MCCKFNASFPPILNMKRQKQIFFDVHIKERWHEGYQNCLTDTSRLYRADTRKKESLIGFQPAVKRFKLQAWISTNVLS